MRTAYRVRQAVNALNLSTLLGLGLASGLGATLRQGPDGLVIAEGPTRRLLRASAFTVGNVVIVARADPPPELLAHESRHSTQWAFCVLLFLPLYWMACLWSWVRCGDHWSRNVFEQRAGLTDGGYVEQATRSVRRRLEAARAAGTPSGGPD